MNYNKLTIGERIKTARCKPFNGNPGYSQGSLAVALGLDSTSRTTIRKWERGEALPPLDHLLKMCELFGCELGYLLGEYDLPTRTATDIQQETGLSRNAIEQLRCYKAAADGKGSGFDRYIASEADGFLQMLSMMIQHRGFFSLVTGLIHYAELYNSSPDFILKNEKGTTVTISEVSDELRKQGWSILSNREAADFHLYSCVDTLRAMAKDIWEEPETYK